MDKQMLEEYRRRWQAVAEVEALERRQSSIEDRWRQTDALFRLAVGLGWSPASYVDDEELAIWQRWQILRQEMT